MKTNVKAGFTDEMLIILSSMKGKTLKSIQGVFIYDKTSTHGNLRLALGQFAVDIECGFHVEPLINFDDEFFYDEVSYFSCEKKKLTDEFVPYIDDKTISFVVNEYISEIVLIRDEITVSNGEHYIIDQALSIKTANKAYTFSRREIIDESIYINESDKIEGFQSIKEVKDAWDGEGRYSVDVNRQFVFL